MAEEVRRKRDDLQRQVEELKIVESFHLKSAGIGVVEIADSEVSEVSIPKENLGHLKYKEAVRQIMENVGKPMLVKEIVNLLSALGKGTDLKASSLYNSIMSTLTRNPELFTRLKGRWILVKNTKGTNYED